jgi:hypothetical protein
MAGCLGRVGGLVDKVIDLFGEAICGAATEPDGDNDATVGAS